VNDVGVIDEFLRVFTRYIDSGFGLVRGDVASLASILVAIDVTLAALFWAWSPGEEILARLVKKTLYVGFFAFLLNDFARLAQVVFSSFSGLGLKAAGAGLSAEDVMRPGRIAATGVDAVRPLLEACGELAGFPAIFENFVQIAVLLASVLVVLVAFFVLAVQLFVVVIEFKLTTLAGFVLVPFGLFGRTAFLAERVLGNVVASGVKVLVLAVIVGIGSTLFDSFVAEFSGSQPDLEQVLAVALAAICLLGLGIFGPGIATGLVSGAPQLGAGAAVATTLATGGLALAGAAGVRSAAGAVAQLRGVVGAGRGGGLSPGSGGGGGGGPEAPHGGPAGGGAAHAGAPATGRASASRDEPPAWARRLRNAQALARGFSMAASAVRSGERPGGSVVVPLSEEKP
jgi:type IV secretion system protein TrbL